MRLLANGLFILILASFGACASNDDSGAFDKNGVARRVPIQTPGSQGAGVHRERAEVALEARVTNAERLKRGLPLLAPRRLDEEKRGVSVVTCSAPAQGGVIAAYRQDNGNFFGYVSKVFNAQYSYTVTSDMNLALRVSLPSGSSSPLNKLIEIGTNNGPSVRKLIGAVGGSGGYTFGPGLVGYAYLSGTGPTAANAPPSFKAGNSLQARGYHGPTESRIWTVNCQLDISVQWVNTDGSVQVATPFFNSFTDAVYIGGDLARFNQIFPKEPTVALKLKYAVV